MPSSSTVKLSYSTMNFSPTRRRTILPVNHEPRNPSSSELTSTKVPGLKMVEAGEEERVLELDAMDYRVRVSQL